MKLRNFFLWSWLIISILFNIVYLISGAADGLGLANCIEILFAIIPSVLITLIYFIFTH